MKRAVIFSVALVIDVLLVNYGLKQNTFESILQLSSIKEEVLAPPCSAPIHYKIDHIDPEFQLTADDLAKDASAAAQIWNSAEDRKLFIYDPNGELSVNLIYDGRQKLSSTINQLQNTLQSVKKTLDPQEVAYQAKVTDYEQKSATLKAEIDSWNEKGGAPQDVADQLNARRDDLQREADALNEEAKRLNELSQSFNSKVGTLNKTVNVFNTQLDEKPEEGLFKGDTNTIEVYFNNGKTELIHTLAHEMGHALGMNHVDDKKAIMFASTNQNIKPTTADLKELKNTCQDGVVQRIN